MQGHKGSSREEGRRQGEVARLQGCVRRSRRLWLQPQRLLRRFDWLHEHAFRESAPRSASSSTDPLGPSTARVGPGPQ